MRSFKTTAVIFVVGVLASKIITGSADTPLYNRFQGEVLNGSDWKARKTGVHIDLELYKVGYGDRASYIEFKFSGNQENLQALGLPENKVTCYVKEAGRVAGSQQYGLRLLYKLDGESKFCSGIQFNPNQGVDYIGVLFDSKDRILSSQVRRNNSRGIIVGMMQSLKYNDWALNGDA